jgi:membrane protein YdbS with pleckstrin-like domain
MPNTPASAEIVYTFHHDRLRRYLRVRGFVLWVGTLGMLGALLGFPAAGKKLDSPRYDVRTKLIAASRAAGIGFGAGALLGAFCYVALTHFRSSAEARTASLRVDGPFVRLKTGGFMHTDRKIHFRSIIDYAVVDGPLRRRFGLQTLQMTVPTGVPNGLIQLTGLHDCERVRDELAALDAAREHLNG